MSDQTTGPRVTGSASSQTKPPASTAWRFAQLAGDWTRSIIIVIAWGIALAATLTAGYLVIQALRWFVQLSQQALGV